MMKKVLVLLASLFFWSQLAWGHASLLAASPAPGAVLEHAPSEIVLTFNEPVGITRLRLIDPQGRDVHTGPAVDRDTKIRIPLIASPAAGPRGTFLLSWRIVSADGHPVGGTLDYSVGAPSAQAPAAGSGPAVARDAAIWLTRWLTYLCLFAAAGAALFRAFNPPLRQAWAWPFVVAGLALLPADLALQGLDLGDVPGTALSQAATWRMALGSTYATTLGLYALGLLAAAASLAMRPVPSGQLRLLGVASVVLAGVGAASSGHVGTAPPEWLSRPLVTLHVICAIAWIGLLIPLARALRPQPAHAAVAAPGGASASVQAPSPLAGFSRWILPTVIVLALSGLAMAFLQLDRPADLWQTDYGRVLLAKLCLVGLLLCLAAYNRWRLTPSALSGTLAGQRLRHTITVEIVLAAVLLAVVSLWRFTPPPRSLDAGQAILSAVTLADSQVHAQVNPGAGNWHIRLTTPAGAPFPAQAVTLILDNPAAGIEPMQRKAQHTQGDLWEAPVPVLPETGKWDVAVEILVDDFNQVTLKSGDTAQGGPAGTAGMAGMHMDGPAHAH